MDLSAISEDVRAKLDAKMAAREETLAASRRSIRASANAIRAIHRESAADQEEPGEESPVLEIGRSLSGQDLHLCVEAKLLPVPRDGEGGGLVERVLPVRHDRHRQLGPVGAVEEAVAVSGVSQRLDHAGSHPRIVVVAHDPSVHRFAFRLV